jgi:nucleoid-associated protein YgaU
MLRKDVKLGFAIGGIMLAVVVVYVLVVPGGDKKGVSVVTDESGSKSDITPLPVPADQTVDGKTAEPETADKSNAPPANPADAVQPPATMPSAAAGAFASDASTGGTPTASAGGTSAGGGADWNKLLAEGSSSPTMMSETPTAPIKTPDAQADAGPTAPQSTTADRSPTSASPTSASPTPASPDNAQALAAAAEKSAPDLAIDTSSDKMGTPATQPAESGQRTHIVQPGEMLSTIAAATYGSSRKWKLIAEANPGINPNRLAPGTKLIIPALTTPSESTAVTASATIDSRTQYEVQPSDSLYRISMKLYGKPDHVDKLYQDNKDVIGSDPRRLKLNMVLKLTDPPTSDSVAATR